MNKSAKNNVKIIRSKKGIISYNLVPVPSRITGTYKDDFNILRVHDIILSKFHVNDMERIRELQSRINSEVDKINSLQTIIEKKKSERIIQESTKTIEELNSQEKEYLLRVTSILEEYKNLGTEVSEQKHLIIGKYLEIVRIYIQIDVIRETNSSNKCKGCNYDMTDVVINDCGLQVCPNCDLEKNIFGLKTSVAVHKTIYNDRNNFIKALDRFEGKIKPADSILQEIYKELDTYFKSKNKPTGDEIRKRPLTARGRKEGTSKELLYESLAAIDRRMYEHDNIICNEYWGWELPDISHLRVNILDKYDATQSVYISLPNKDRKSSLNIPYRMFKQLQLEDYPCYQDDFKIVKTRETLENLDAIWKQMCEGCHREDIYFIPTL